MELSISRTMFVSLFARVEFLWLFVILISTTNDRVATKPNFVTGYDMLIKKVRNHAVVFSYKWIFPMTSITNPMVLADYCHTLINKSGNMPSWLNGCMLLHDRGGKKPYVLLQLFSTLYYVARVCFDVHVLIMYQIVSISMPIYTNNSFVPLFLYN